MAEVQALAAAPSTRRVVRRLWPWVRPERSGIAVAITMSLVQSASVVAAAPLIGAVTDAVLAGDRQRVLLLAGALLALVIAQIALTRAAQYRLATTGERVVRRWRNAVVQSLGRAPLRWLEATRPGELLQRATVEIAELATFVRSDLPEALAVAGSCALTVIVLISYSPVLAGVALLIMVPGTALVLRSFLSRSAVVFAGLAEAEARAAGEFAEIVTNREQLMARGATDARLARFDRANTAAVAATRRSVRVENRIEVTTLVEGLTVAAVLGFGLFAAQRGWLTVGTVVVFVLASRTLFEATVTMSQLLGSMQAARINGARLADLLQRSASTVDAGLGADRGTGRLPERGDLTMQQLSFGYRRGQLVLDGVQLEFPAGTRTAVVGRTGSGKTTLIKLLTGLYEPDAGVVSFGGIDLRTASSDDLRRRIVLIPQRVHLINGSIRDNIMLLPGEPPDDQRIDEVIDRLGLRQWVQRLPSLLESPVGQGGHLLSAGERQIVGLIRAALVDPAVLVLDEATADIDPQTAAGIENALAALHPAQTLIVIAHRPATAGALPRIVRLEAGRVVEDTRRPQPIR